MTKDFLDVFKLALNYNYEQFEHYRTNKEKDLQKEYLEYIIDNANDIVKFGTELLKSMEKSDK